MSVNLFDADPRTAGVGGDRTNRRELSKRSQALFRALGPGERVLWTLGCPGLRPRVGAVTASRVLLFSLTEPAAAPLILESPYTLTAGRKKLLGQSVTICDHRGREAELTLSPRDHEELHKVVARERMGRMSGAGDEPPRQGTRDRSTAGGGWRWGHPVRSWQEAEMMAADHMRHMGFAAVTVTPPGRDNGLDVISRTGAAQVKRHLTPVGAPEVQQLRGAADAFPLRLFYASSYTPAALTAAEALGVATFQFTDNGDVVGVNAVARTLMATQAPPAPSPERGVFGQLTQKGRQERALAWARQIQDAADKPISNRKRKGARQLTERKQALQLVVTGLAQLEDSGNPLYKKTRQDRTLREAEKTLKQAASLLGVWLR